MWTNGIGGHLYVSQSLVCEMTTFSKSRRWTPNWTWCNCTQYHKLSSYSHTSFCNKMILDAVRVCLDRTFPGTWIFRDGPMPWPPCSPDITRLDFFSCGVMSSNVFRTPVNGLDDPKSYIRIFQRTCSIEHGNNSNIVWTLFVLSGEPILRSTEVIKKLPKLRCNLPQTACG
jgi:hypothetical protein